MAGKGEEVSATGRTGPPLEPQAGSKSARAPKDAVLRAARAFGLFALCRWLTRGQLRILCYHGIWNGPPPHYGDCLFMSAQVFARRMQMLVDAGYKVITLEEACRRLPRGETRAKDIVITIDDAWAGVVEHMLPVLRSHKFPATLYVTTYYVLARKPVLNVLIAYIVERSTRDPASAKLAAALPGDAPPAKVVAVLAAHVDALPTMPERWAEVLRLAEVFGVDLDTLRSRRAFELMNPQELRDARAHGIDLQLHTHTHRLHDFSVASVQRELDVNRELLAQWLDCTADALKHFCYPSGEYDPAVFATLRAAGVVSATTTEFGLNKADAEPLALKRVLDCESLSDLELEARLSGFWSLTGRLRENARRALRFMRERGEGH
jgi:peptidoglycan/xylan/chitin deacetylase (PgdA/CDA1 family)